MASSPLNSQHSPPPHSFHTTSRRPGSGRAGWREPPRPAHRSAGAAGDRAGPAQRAAAAGPGPRPTRALPHRRAIPARAHRDAAGAPVLPRAGRTRDRLGHAPGGAAGVGVAQPPVLDPTPLPDPRRAHTRRRLPGLSVHDRCRWTRWRARRLVAKHGGAAPAARRTAASPSTAPLRARVRSEPASRAPGLRASPPLPTMIPSRTFQHILFQIAVGSSPRLDPAFFPVLALIACVIAACFCRLVSIKRANHFGSLPVFVIISLWGRPAPVCSKAGGAVLSPCHDTSALFPVPALGR